MYQTIDLCDPKVSVSLSPKTMQLDFSENGSHTQIYFDYELLNDIATQLIGALSCERLADFAGSLITQGLSNVQAKTFTEAVIEAYAETGHESPGLPRLAVTI